MFLGIITSLLIPTYVGFVLQEILFRRPPPFALRMSLSYGLGLGVITQWMLGLGILGVSYNLLTVGCPLLILALFRQASHLMKKVPGEKFPLFSRPVHLTNRSPQPTRCPFDIVSRLMQFFILASVTFISWMAISFPLQYWDELSFIAFNGKIFFFEGSLFPQHLLPRPAFPLHVPLSFCWVALNLGSWDEHLVKVFIPPFLVSLLGLCYVFLRQYISQRWSLFSLVLLLSSAFFTTHATLGYRDFTMTYYLTVTLLLLLYWYRRRDDGFLFLASLSAGFMTFTKLEGGVYFFLLLFLFYLFPLRRKKLTWLKQLPPFIKFLIPGLIIYLIFALYKISQGITLDPTEGRVVSALIPIEHLKEVNFWFTLSLKNIFASSNWNILWGLLILSLSHTRRSRNPSRSNSY